MPEIITVGGRRLEGEQYLLPSGARTAIRGLTVKELDKLGNRKKLRDGSAYHDILAACAEDFDPLTALMGDRLFTLIAIRIETHGPDFHFQNRCPECSHQFGQAVNLEELVVRELAGPGPFELTLPKACRKLTWRLLTGADEQRLAREFADELEEHGLSLSLALRTTKIEGEPMVARSFFETLSAQDAGAFLADIEARDCGVVTRLDVQCPRCAAAYQTNLQLDPTFLLPPKTKQK